MAAIDFPNSPTVGQIFTSGTRSWIWTGTVWDSISQAMVAPDQLHPMLLAFG